jgi:hypothetical protein
VLSTPCRQRELTTCFYSVKEAKLKSCITSVLESNSCSTAHVAKVLLDQDNVLGSEAPELSAQIKAVVTVLTK